MLSIFIKNIRQKYSLYEIHKLFNETSWNMNLQNIENCLNYCNMNNSVWHDYRHTGYSGHIKGPTCAYPVSVGAKQ